MSNDSNELSLNTKSNLEKNEVNEPSNKKNLSSALKANLARRKNARNNKDEKP